MIFGEIALDKAQGAILAHGIRHADGVFKKGRVLSRADVAVLAAAGITQVKAALLEADDVPEDVAAHRIAVASAGKNTAAQQAFTGRANLHSVVHGVVVLDEARIRALNHLHESLTIATLPNYAVVDRKQMVATVKVIPFAVPQQVMFEALKIIKSDPLVQVSPFTPHRVGLVITRLPHTKPSIVAKSESAIRARVETLGSTIGHVTICGHTERDVSDAIAELHDMGCSPILVLGASAIVDRLDVIPAGLAGAGGEVVHLGMPVDPGNLLMLGRLGDSPVIGVPSCARSPKVNGFDWVLERLLSGIPVSRSDIMDMGAGGLLAEITSRPSPREPKTALPKAPRVVAVVLAAGASSRMGVNKMLADFNGLPLVRATVEKVLSATVDEVIVVTGRDRDKIEEALRGLRVRLAHNAGYEQGLSTSIRTGLENLRADAVVICLADMPLVEGVVIDRLIAAYNPTEQRTIIVPSHHGQLGNPVLWGAEHFAKLMTLEGDRGARALLGEFKSDLVEIEAGTDAVLRDADTPEALEDMRMARLPRDFLDHP